MWSIVPTQWGIEAEKSGAWCHVQKVKWCWRKTNASNAVMVHSKAPHLLHPPKENGQCCFLGIFNQLLNYYSGNGNHIKTKSKQ